MSAPPANAVHDSRRVPGSSLWNDGPAVLLDLVAIDAQGAVVRWHGALDRLLAACPVPRLGRRIAQTWSGVSAGRSEWGATVGFEAPLSVLYDAVDLNEWAAEVALGLRRLDDALDRARRLAPTLAAAYDAPLERLLDRARGIGSNALIGERTFTLGSGRHARSWPLDALPEPDAVPWEAVRDVPLALVTGTNGKTTTTRLVRRMLDLAGIAAGHTSTEGVHMGVDELVGGDFAGPEGARRLLRDARVEAAVLETSRGGLLRRGLAVQQAAVAVVTNVGPDHVGEYGIWTTADIARAKLTVRKALRLGAPLVVNADDPILWAEAVATGHAPLHPFSLSDGPVVREAAMHARTAYVHDGEVRLAGYGWERVLCRVEEMPLAFGGSAMYNVANALAATLVAVGLGVDYDDPWRPEDRPRPEEMNAISHALRTFGAAPDDNPGRLNVHRVPTEDGGMATVVVDYGHNDAGIRAVAPALATLPRRRTRVLISQAGDRSDADNARMTAEIVALGPDDVVLTELPGYERGRAVGETVESLARGFTQHGLAAAHHHTFARPLDGARFLLDTRRGGDLVVLFLHGDRAAVLDHVRASSGQGRPSGEVS